MAKLVCFTGAGLSADSGISTFRDVGGLWEGHEISVVANYFSWKRHFETVHRFYNQRRTELSTAQPNPAHHLLAQWQGRYETVLLTQNVDDLIERAGCTDVVHVHGKLREMKCTACGTIHDIGYREWDCTSDRCPKCNSLKGMKPNVVFFDENAPYYRIMWKTFMGLKREDVLVVIGTSGQVIDIGSVAAMTKATTVLSNLESAKTISMPGSPVVEDRQFDYVIHGRASETASSLDKLISDLMSRKSVDEI